MILSHPAAPSSRLLPSRLHALRALRALLVLPALSPSVLHAQEAPRTEFISFGVGAGASVPLGDLGRAVGTGVHATARMDVMPLGAPWFLLRGDVSYDRFGRKAPIATTTNAIGVSASAVLRGGDFTDPHGLKGYLVAGGGYWRFRDSAPESRARGGFGATVGGGLEFGVGDFAGFLETRLNGAGLEGGTVRWMPVVVGVRF